MPGLGFLKKKRTREDPPSGHHSTISNIISHMPGHHSGSSHQQQLPSASSGPALPGQPQGSLGSSGADQQLQGNPHAASVPLQQHHQHPLPTPPTSTSAGAGTAQPTNTTTTARDPQSHNAPHTIHLVNTPPPQYDGAGQAEHSNLNSNISPFNNSAASLGVPATSADSVSPGADHAALQQQQLSAHPTPPSDAMHTDHDEQQAQAQQQNIPQQEPPQQNEQQQHGHHHLLGLGHHQPQASTTQQQQHSSTQSQARVTKGKYTLVDFDILRTLGTGSFGRVHLVQSKHNQRYYAIKVLKKTQVVKMKQIEHTNDERRMLSDVKHPFLITLWGTFQDWKNLYMVMDFVEGGELFSLLRKSGVSKVVIHYLCKMLYFSRYSSSELTQQQLHSDSQTPSQNSTPLRSPWRWSIFTPRTSFIAT